MHDDEENHKTYTCYLNSNTAAVDKQWLIRLTTRKQSNGGSCSSKLNPDYYEWLAVSRAHTSHSAPIGLAYLDWRGPPGLRCSCSGCWWSSGCRNSGPQRRPQLMWPSSVAEGGLRQLGGQKKHNVSTDLFLFLF